MFSGLWIERALRMSYRYSLHHHLRWYRDLRFPDCYQGFCHWYQRRFQCRCDVSEVRCSGCGRSRGKWRCQRVRGYFGCCGRCYDVSVTLTKDGLSGYLYYVTAA